MLFLVKDILDFAQIESKSLILNIEPTIMMNLVEESIQALLFKAEEKGLRLEAR